MFSEAAGAQDMPLVNAIEVKGLKRIGEGVVRGKITQQAGELLSDEKVSDDIKAIYKLGYFEDVRAEVEPFEGGVKLIYVVREKPAIVSVDFQGNDKIEDSKLREAVTITPGSISDTVLIQRNADKLRALYEEKGYALALVVPVLRRVGEDRLSLTYQIQEGPRVKIKSIKILGNKAISARKIKKVMKTSRRWFLSFLTGSGYYEKTKLSADIEKIRDLYYDKGFVKVVVSEPTIELTEDRKWMTITIQISEGEQFRISAIEFSGNTVFTDEQLREKIESAEGNFLSRRLLGADVASLTEMYSDKGYAMVSIYPDIMLDEGRNQAKVIFRISEGDIYRVGRIEIFGNQRTRDKVIRREMKLNEGDVFSGSLLRKSYRRINNLNFFEEVVLEPKPDPERKTLDIDIKVKERQTGFLSVGGGYSSVDRFIGMIDLTQGNLGGRGQYIKLKSEFGSRSSFYEFSFTDPWFLDKPVSFTTSIFNTRREYTNYNKRASGFMFGFGKEFREYWKANISYSFEKATIFDVEETASDIIKEQEGSRTTSSVSASLARDSRDNFLDPHTGSRNVLSVKYAGIGGDNKFFRGGVDSTWFVPIGTTTLAFRGRYGYATGLFGEKLPLYERFYVGGIYTVRGLGFGQAGPKAEDGAPIGGTKRIIFNVDYTFPLISAVRLKGVVFFDAGTAYDDHVKLRYTTGFGVRWISPIGPLRLEWGKNLEPQPGEADSRWEFAIGTFF
jgi:outer membrane protein insertion porin family